MTNAVTDAQLSMSRADFRAAIDAGIESLYAKSPQEHEELVRRLRIVAEKATECHWGTFGVSGDDSLDVNRCGCPLTKIGAVAPNAHLSDGYALGYSEGFFYQFDRVVGEVLMPQLKLESFAPGTRHIFRIEG